MDDPIRIAVLGELRVFAPDGSSLALPASRKTRALLAYLALTRRRQFRSHLCDLLWDGPDDPRGALRWSLSRLRAGLNSTGLECLVSDRRSVGLAPGSVVVDLFSAQEIMAAARSDPSIESLREVAALFEGDLLEGLDLLDSFRFHAWCVGQREAARALRLGVLRALVDQVDDADEALMYAHTLVSIDPLSEAAQTTVVRLLMQMQRHHDAQEQVSAYRRTLEIEFGEVPKDVASRLRKIVHGSVVAPPASPARLEPSDAVESVPFVGRAEQLETLQVWLTHGGDAPAMAVLGGEPGAGKTRLMREVSNAYGDTVVIVGRAYRAENARGFGPWRDALAEVDGALVVLASVGDESATGEPQQRAELFDELLRLIEARASTALRLIVALDDLQWFDETSVAFLHYLVRMRTSNVRILATVRTEEIIDNVVLAEALESLRRAQLVLDVRVPQLSQAEVTRLCAAIDRGVDADRVFSLSEGNPFVATEIVRALTRGETDLPSNVRELVAARLRRLSEPARELLPWAAALGRRFHVDVLERVTGLDPLALLARVGELEERGVFEPSGMGSYDFVHDLVRSAAYHETSEPRRRIVHRSVARKLAAWHAPAGVSPIELLRHAELGGEGAIAARAGAAAAREALSVCAWSEACVIADRGLQHVASLDGEATEVTLALLTCRIHAASLLGRNHPKHVASMVADLVNRSTTAHRAQALVLQSMLSFDHGEAERAERELLAAADASRHAGSEEAARRLAHSARCLLHVESDVEAARSLLGEARAALGALGLEDAELAWAEALMARWDGDLPGAAQHLLRAIELAKAAGSHWRQSSCQTGLVMIASEQGDPERVQLLLRGRPGEEKKAQELLQSPFVEGLAGLADVQHDLRSTERLDRASDVLRTRGAHAQLAYLLAESARLNVERRRLEAAEAAANEAVQLAALVRRSVPRTDALITLAEVRKECGDLVAAAELLKQAEQLAEGGVSVTARVWNRLRAHSAQVRHDEIAEQRSLRR